MKTKTPRNSSLSLILLAIATASTCLHAAADLVVNGGFEPDETFTLTNSASGYAGSTGFGTNQTFGGSGYTGPSVADVPGFTGTAPRQNGTPTAYIQLLGTNYENANGLSTGFVATIEGGSISETVAPSLQADSLYTLTFDASKRPDQPGPAGGAFTANLDAGSTALSPLSGSVDPSLTGTFEQFTVTYDTSLLPPSMLGQPLTIIFGDTSFGSAQVLLDNVSLNVTGPTSTPEPYTAALLLGGVGAAALLARFRLRQS